jgi:hypothetical protein
MTWPRNQQPPDPMENPGTSTKTSKTSARRRTRRSPMLAHETSPVSGASVVGMTYRAYHRQSNMLADVPGVPMTSAREGRLRPKGRLRQQPAGDSVEESWSRVQKIRFLQRWDRQKQPKPDKIDRSQDGSDARHDRAQPISDRGSFPTKGPRRARASAPQMPDQREKCAL